MNVLVLNCGSSSVKYLLYDMPARSELARGIVQRIGDGRSAVSHQGRRGRFESPVPAADHHQALSLVASLLTDPAHGAIDTLDEVGACGHRVVHGGEAFSGSVAITPEVIEAIERNTALAPLHNPPNLAGIRAAAAMLKNAPQVACFDTAFHQTMPPTAFLYALPYELYERERIRKYGFHGTSHRWAACRAAELLGKPLTDTRLITCHLGNGCSIAAVRGGKCVDTSMGLTPLEGVMMGTRTGDIDPAVVFHLLRTGHGAEELEATMNRRSGLLGVSGISNDLRDLERRGAEPRALLALEMFAYRVRKYIGAYLAALNGADAVVFTGGIGENGVAMRERIVLNMDSLGIALDMDANERVTGGCEGRIEAAGSAVALVVVAANEEAAIAEETYSVVTQSQKHPT